MQNFSTHLPSKLSRHQWDGLHSSKFQVGKYHNNHPDDQLDTLMISVKSACLPPQGKKQFHNQIKPGYQPQYRSHLKTFEKKYKKSIIFAQENIEKLIKVPFTSKGLPNDDIKFHLHDKYNYSTIGTSKIKALMDGSKKTGIYRQFYNSQIKSTNTFKTIE